MMTEISKVKIGAVLKGKRTGNTYEVVDYKPTSWGHGIYHLVCYETKERRTIADFAMYRKFEVVS